MINLRNPAQILFMAFRYALTRRTYISRELADEILFQWPHLEAWMKRKFKQEIEEHFRLYAETIQDTDMKQWVRILEEKI